MCDEDKSADAVILETKMVMQEMQDAYQILDSFIYEAENVFELRMLIEEKIKSDSTFRDTLSTVKALSGLLNRETMAFDMQARLK